MAALLDLRMPGVYTQEIPTLPPSVAVIPTAVPIFIGHTEMAKKDGKDITLTPTRIRNLRDYETWFGAAPAQKFEVEIDDQTSQGGKLEVVVAIPENEKLKYTMHYALQLYYTNGGGPCYIVSVGNYSTTDLKNELEKGIQSCVKLKEGTMIIMPDAINLTGADYGGLISMALMHCEKMKNRVTIIDVHDSNKEDDEQITTNFRNHMISDIDYKKYGAAYYPFLETTLDYQIIEGNVKLTKHKVNGQEKASVGSLQTALTNINNAKAALKTETNDYSNLSFKAIDAIYKILHPGEEGDIEDGAAAGGPNLPDLRKQIEAAYKKETGSSTLPVQISNEFDKAEATPEKVKTLIDDIYNKLNAVKTAKDAYTKAAKEANNYKDATGDLLKDVNNMVYSQIVEQIRRLPVVLPPSSAIAGVYVRTDFTQGVWKAPANTSLVNVIRPTVEIDDDFHANLNVTTSGKSVNAIRTYQGKGVLVFGARTLAGNDNEWRYISVRRTFCFIEDSIARAMEDFVFAPNIRDTWIKVKATISNFLNGIWKAGGLFGDTPDEAYSVSVGLPETMSDLDILEGRMIIEIKLRVSRPAEFIILRYEHKFNITNA